MKVELSEDIVVQPEITAQTIDMAYEQWRSFIARYEKLRDYYVGKQDFDPDLHGQGQNRIVSNHCRYITDVLVGYQYGNEPRYTTSDGDTVGEAIIDLFNKQDKWNVDTSIGEDMSIFGRALELVYTPEDKDEPSSIPIDPLHGFVAYAGDVERDSVFGCVVFEYENDRKQKICRLYIYDRANVSVWESDTVDKKPRLWRMIDTPKPHGFGRVPLIEYKNNRRAMSDFESVMELQDAYNASISDRQDNEDAFTQATLVLSGEVMGMTEDEVIDSRKKLRKIGVLHLGDDASAEFLVKQVDESGVQVALDALSSDLHKLAYVPDLSDEQFAGNASGVAMAYKLFGTDQIVSKKQSQVQKGFTRRCKLYDFRMNNPTMDPNYTPMADIENMVITFNLNAPQDLSYVASAVTQLVGSQILSRQTARAIISVIPDPEKEGELVDEEAETDIERARAPFDADEVDDRRKEHPEEELEPRNDDEDPEE